RVRSAQPEADRPWCLAGARGRLETIKVLIAKGAALDGGDEEGCSPMEKAIEGGKTASVRLWMEKDSTAFSSAMVFAIQRDDRKLLAFLQEKKPSVDALILQV